jgi:glycosyltransferase involved in cell wall biosynthesis
LNEPFDISVIICTYNRCDLLKKSIESLLSQECDQVRYELIIVDNNSADQTKQMCQSILSLCDLPVRYIFEPQQGVSYARNAGIAQAKAPILAFSDDDVWVSKNWIASIKRAFDEHPEIAAIGGKVLPEWQEKPPKWLTRKHWTPLALQDYCDVKYLSTSVYSRLLYSASKMASGQWKTMNYTCVYGKPIFRRCMYLMSLSMRWCSRRD